MFQCLGLAGESEGGCGEDWWHPECVLGLGRNWNERKKVASENGHLPSENGPAEMDENREENNEHEELPPGFPQEDDFETFICYKCVNANLWIKRYAGSTGFLLPVFLAEGATSKEPDLSLLKQVDEAHAGSKQSDEDIQSGTAE